MADEIHNTFNEKLVELVSHHKILYDPYCEGYNSNKAQYAAWCIIAKALGLDVTQCKIKWKNIRSCYTRYIRQTAAPNSFNKKQYYLARHLNFLNPFVKNHEDYTLDSGSGDDSQMEFIDPIKVEDEKESISIHEDELKQTVEADYPNNKRKVETNENPTCKREKLEAELDFFKSILPEVSRMTGKQKNTFKITVLKAINDILYTND